MCNWGKQGRDPSCTNPYSSSFPHSETGANAHFIAGGNFYANCHTRTDSDSHSNADPGA